jgi:hypothetical protein
MATSPTPAQIELPSARAGSLKVIPVTVAAGDIPKILENKSSRCGKMEMILQLRG